jgi:methyl coenzyme M reductase alpha subunit
LNSKRQGLSPKSDVETAMRDKWGGSVREYDDAAAPSTTTANTTANATTIIP